MLGFHLFSWILLMFIVLTYCGLVEVKCCMFRTYRLGILWKKEITGEIIDQDHYLSRRSVSLLSGNQRERKKLVKNKKQRRRNNKSKERSFSKRQSTVFEGNGCEFVDLESVTTSGSGCEDGTKMVLKGKYEKRLWYIWWMKITCNS